jgi:beta-1,4-mannosyltransferase
VTDQPDSRMEGAPAAVEVLMSPAPDGLSSNPFFTLLFAEAANRDTRINAFSRKALLLRRHDVIHIHWPEWHVRWEAIRSALTDIATFITLLWLARRRGAAVVWTGHNLEPHEIPRPRLWRFFQRCFLSQVDLLISFGEGATSLLENRYPQLAQVPVSIVPHGHCRDYYPAHPDVAALREELALDERPVFLYFGLIRPYKEVPALIRSWKHLPVPPAQLIVAGHPQTPELETAIRREAVGAKDVHLILRVIDDDEVPTLFAAADAVIMPYGARSALNSGVAHLALSLARPVVVNDTVANRDLRDAFGPDWVWLCDGTPEGTIRVALDAAAASRSEEPDLSALDAARLGAKIRQAYSEAMVSRRRSA